MRKLTDNDKKILTALSEHGAHTTKGIATRLDIIWAGNNKRQRSGAIRSWLERLEKEGLVRRADAEKPTVWMMTS